IRDRNVTGVQTCALPISNPVRIRHPGPLRMANSYGIRTRIRTAVPPTLAGRNKVASNACRADATNPGLVAEITEIDCDSTRPVEIGRASCRERVEMAVGS